MDAKALWEQAHRHAECREFEQAKRCFEAILVKRPEEPAVLVELSYLFSITGDYRAARNAALRAVRPDRELPPAVAIKLMPRLRTFNEAKAFHQLVDGFGPLHRIPIPQLLACAAQLSYFNEQERAMQMLDEAKRADPDYPATLMSRAQILTYLARFDEAEQDLLSCRRRAPEIAQIYWLLSRLRKQTPQRNHVDWIREQLARLGRTSDEIATLGYALHKELDDLQDYEESSRALDMACRAKRSALNYNSEDSRRLVDALIEFDSCRMPTATLASELDPTKRVPLFIVGMHRSGTTLLEQLLDGHSQVRGIGELYDFTVQMRYATGHHCRGVIDSTIVQRANSVEFSQVGKAYLENVEWRLGAERFFTDKLPSNFFNIGFICRALPQARILNMVRDPIETCFSNLRELFSEANPHTYNQHELAQYFHQYRRLMDYWRAHWSDRILDVNYAELTRDPDKMMRRVMEFCGLEFEPEVLNMAGRTRGVATASAVQVRQGISALEQPKWTPYEAFLQPLIRSLP
jgi:tetratricopeptide (TPR) repeat protein